MAFLSVVRLVLYCFFVSGRQFDTVRLSTRSLMAHHRNYQWIFAVVLMGLTAARIHYTENLSPEDPLNGGHHFYDPVIAELLAASILSALWSTFASVLYRAFSRRWA
jgi:hypothetical protein